MLMLFNCNVSDPNVFETDSYLILGHSVGLFVSLKPTDTLFLDIQSVFLR